MLDRQRGALNLVWVAVLSALLALAAMAALFSMRYERNLFAEAWDRVDSRPVGWAPVPTHNVPALRKCLIGGKAVVSNTDCTDDNKTSKAIAIHDSRGIEPPKKTAPAKEAEPSSNPMIDKIVEKQLR